MFAKAKVPEPTPTRREYSASGPLPVLFGRRLVQWTLIDRPWNAWVEGTGSNGQPEATFYSLAGALCHGPVSQLRNIYLNGRRVGWVGSQNLPIPFKARPSDPADPEYYFADFAFGIDGGNKHTPVQGRIYWGDPLQPADPLLSRQELEKAIARGTYRDGFSLRYGLASGQPSSLLIGAPPNSHPAYGGLCYVIFYSFETDFSAREGGTAIGDVQFEIVKGNTLLPDALDLAEHARYGVNPIGFLYELLRDPVWGLGLPESVVPFAVWQNAAQRMGTEGYDRFIGERIKAGYFSPLLTESRSAAQLLAGLLDYFDGFLRVENGALVPDWFTHQPIEITTLPVIERAHLVEELRTVHGEVNSLEDTLNEVAVEYTDGAQLFGSAVRTVRSPYNRALVGEPRRLKLEARHLIDGESAEAFAARRLCQRAIPRPRYVLELPTADAVNTAGSPFLPGALFVLNYEPWALHTVVRLIEREEQEATVRLTAEEEPGHFPMAYVPQDDTRVLPEIAQPLPFEHWRLWTVPLALGGQVWPPLVAILASRANMGILDAEVWFSPTGAFSGEEQLLPDKLNAFAGRAVLAAAMTADDIALPLTNLNPDAVLLASRSYSQAERDDNTLLALVDDELFSLGQLILPPEDSHIFSMARGRFGSAPAAHAAGAEVWLFLKHKLPKIAHEKFRLAHPYNASAATTYWRLAPQTLLETGPITPTRSHQISKPFPEVSLGPIPASVLFGQTVIIEGTVTPVNASEVNVALVRYHLDTGQQEVLVFLRTLEAVNVRHELSILPPAGNFRIGLWAWQEGVPAAAAGRDFAALAPELTPEVTAPPDAPVGTPGNYYGTVSNPTGMPFRYWLVIYPVTIAAPEILLAYGESDAPALNLHGQHVWASHPIGQYKLVLWAVHTYQNAERKAAVAYFDVIGF